MTRGSRPAPAFLTRGEEELALRLLRLAERLPDEADIWRSRARDVREAHRLPPDIRSIVLEAGTVAASGGEARA